MATLKGWESELQYICEVVAEIENVQRVRLRFTIPAEDLGDSAITAIAVAAGYLPKPAADRTWEFVEVNTHTVGEEPSSSYRMVATKELP